MKRASHRSEDAAQTEPIESLRATEGPIHRYGNIGADYSIVSMIQRWRPRKKGFRVVNRDEQRLWESAALYVSAAKEKS